jgi:hypothetical protein
VAWKWSLSAAFLRAWRVFLLVHLCVTDGRQTKPYILRYRSLKVFTDYTFPRAQRSRTRSSSHASYHTFEETRRFRSAEAWAGALRGTRTGVYFHASLSRGSSQQLSRQRICQWIFGWRGRSNGGLFKISKIVMPDGWFGALSGSCCGRSACPTAPGRSGWCASGCCWIGCMVLGVWLGWVKLKLISGRFEMVFAGQTGGSCMSVKCMVCVINLQPACEAVGCFLYNSIVRRWDGKGILIRYFIGISGEVKWNGI